MSNKLPILFFTSLAFAFYSPTSGAQDREQEVSKLVIESLKAQFLLPAPDTTKYRLAFQIAYELFDVDNPEAVLYSKKAFDLSLIVGDSALITRSGRLYGQLLRRVDRPEEAIAQFLLVLPIAERNQINFEEKKILNALAVSYNFIAMYDKALEYHFKALEILEREGDQKGLSTSLMNIALVYYKMHDLERAIEYNKKSLDIKEKSGNREFKDDLLINLSLCYVSLRNYDLAYVTVQKAFKVCGNNCNDQVKIQGNYCLGMFYLNQKDLSSALSYFEQSYLLSRNIGDKRFQADNLNGISEIEVMNGKYKDAELHLKEAESLAKQSGYIQILMYTYSVFSNLYRLTDDGNNSLAYKNRCNHLRDSIFSQELVSNLSVLQGAYHDKLNIKRLDEQNEMVNQKENEVITARRQVLYILVLSIACITLTFLFYRKFTTR